MQGKWEVLIRIFKQVALKLVEKGLLILQKDTVDARVTRLKLTENSYDFWETIRVEGTAFTQTLFHDIDQDELAVARRVMQKLQLNINEMDQRKERVDKDE